MGGSKGDGAFCRLLVSLKNVQDLQYGWGVFYVAQCPRA